MGPATAVFGRVVSGRDVIESIELVDTGISAWAWLQFRKHQLL